MNETKVRLSADELLIVEDAGWILTKNGIIAKVYDLFGILSEKMKMEMIRFSALPEATRANPKISKGENYKGLPYVILDYPRLFAKEEVFAIRTLFWWANYFSVTLHLKGKFKTLFLENIERHIPLLAANGFYAHVSNDEWLHAIGDQSHIPLDQTDEYMRKKIFTDQSFLKLTAKIDLWQWNESENLLWNAFQVLLQTLGH